MPESMTVLERKNLRRAMYSKEAAKTEEEDKGERSKFTNFPMGLKDTGCQSMGTSGVSMGIVTSVCFVCGDYKNDRC